MNKEWHNKNLLGTGASMARRINWHLAHQKNCACGAIPGSVALALKGKQVKTCSRGHSYIDASFCPIRWPGGRKRQVRKKR